VTAGIPIYLVCSRGCVDVICGQSMAALHECSDIEGHAEGKERRKIRQGVSSYA